MRPWLAVAALVLGACASGTMADGDPVDGLGGTAGTAIGAAGAAGSTVDGTGGSGGVPMGGQGGEMLGGAAGTPAGGSGGDVPMGGAPMMTEPPPPVRQSVLRAIEDHGCQASGWGCEWAPCGRVRVESDNGTTTTRNVSCKAGFVCTEKPMRVMYSQTVNGQIWMDGAGTCVRTCQTDDDCRDPVRGTCSKTQPVCSSVPQDTGVCTHTSPINNYERFCPGFAF